MRVFNPKSVPGAAFALATILAAGAALAADAPPPAAAGKKAAVAAADPAPAPVAAAAEGLVVVRDKETGELRAPSADEAKALMAPMAKALSDSSEGLKRVPLPGGGWRVDLQGRFQSVALARRGPDGRTSQECVTSEKDALRFLTGATLLPVPAPLLEER